MHFSFEHLKRWCRHLAGITALFIILYPSIPGHAATIPHKHNSSCIGETSVVCSKHSFRYVTSVEQVKCYKCKQTVNATHTDVYCTCLEKIEGAQFQYEDDLFGSGYTCPSCGYQSTPSITPDPMAHHVKLTGYACGLRESASVGTFTVSASTAAWTNKPVIITAKVSSTSSYLVLADKPYNFGAGATSSSTYSATANGTYNVSLTTVEGTVVSEKITVANIDTTAPSLSVKTTSDGWSENGFTVLVTASDAMSGLPAAAYSYNGGAWVSDSYYHVKENGTFSVRVRDNAGNISTQSLNITKVGRDPAIVAAEAKAKAEAEARAAAAEAKAAEEARKAAAEQAAREASEKAAAERLAEEQAAREASEKAAAERLAEEQAAREASEKAAAERLAEEVAAREASEKAAAERLAAEEAARKEAESAAAAALSKIDELEAQKKEAARLEEERREAERLATEAAVRLEQERTEEARLEALRLAEAKLEAQKRVEEQNELIRKLEDENAEAKKTAEEKQARYEEEKAAARLAEEEKDARYAAEKKAAEELAEAERIAAAQALEAEHAAGEERLEAEKKAGSDRLEEERLKAEEALAALRRKAEEEMADFAEKHEEEMQETKDRYAKEKQEVLDRYEEEKQAAIEKYETEKQAALERYEADKKETIEKYESEKRSAIAEIESEKTETIRLYEARQSESERLAAELKERLEAEKASVEADAIARIMKLEAEKQEIERLLALGKTQDLLTDRSDKRAVKNGADPKGTAEPEASSDPKAASEPETKQEKTETVIPVTVTVETKLPESTPGESAEITAETVREIKDTEPEEMRVILQEEPEVRLMNAGTGSIIFGLILMILGSLLISCFNYIYISENGRIRPIALVKAVKDSSKIVLRLRSGILEPGERYMVHLSPWIKKGTADLPVFIETDGDPLPVRTDRNSFTYQLQEQA